jgi:hypothetical protein
VVDHGALDAVDAVQVDRHGDGIETACVGTPGGGAIRVGGGDERLHVSNATETGSTTLAMIRTDDDQLR